MHELDDLCERLWWTRYQGPPDTVDRDALRKAVRILEELSQADSGDVTSATGVAFSPTSLSRDDPVISVEE